MRNVLSRRLISFSAATALVAAMGIHFAMPGTAQSACYKNGTAGTWDCVAGCSPDRDSWSKCESSWDDNGGDSCEREAKLLCKGCRDENEALESYAAGSCKPEPGGGGGGGGDGGGY